MTKILLMVEDKNYRYRNLEAFLRHCRDTDPKRDSIELPRVLSYPSPQELKDSLDSLLTHDPEAEIIGALVDFSLGIQQYSDGEETFQDSEANYGEYPVTTGIGVMDHLCRVGRYPRMKLWAMTTRDSAHGPLYYAAANLWFGARPLDPGVFTVPSGDPPNTAQKRTFWDLIDDPRRDNAETPHMRFLRAEFNELLTERGNHSVGGLDDFAWMAAMADATVPANTGGTNRWAKEVKNSAVKIGRRTSPYRKIEPRQLTGRYLQWCNHLQQILKFDEAANDLIEEWPEIDLDEDDFIRSNLIFGKYNFFQNWVCDPRHSTLREFFLAEDVYAALVRWRNEPYVRWEELQ